MSRGSLDRSSQPCQDSKIEQETSLGEALISESPSEEEIEYESDDHYEIERIVNFRVDKGVNMFKIKWKGFGRSESTWELESNLRNCTEMINEFFDHREKATKHRAVFRLKYDFQAQKFLVEHREHQLYPNSKFHNDRKDLYIEDVREEVPENLSDMSDYEDSEELKKAKEKPETPSDNSFDLSGSSFESVQKKPTALTLQAPTKLFEESQEEKRKKREEKKKKQAQAQALPKQLAGLQQKGNHGSYFGGDFPLKVIAHRFLGKSSSTKVDLNLLVRWRAPNGNSKARPAPTWFSNTELEVLDPGLMCSYYKKLFVQMVKRISQNRKNQKPAKATLEEKEAAKANTALFFEKQKGKRGRKKKEASAPKQPMGLGKPAEKPPKQKPDRDAKDSKKDSKLAAKEQAKSAKPKEPAARVVDLTAMTATDQVKGSSYFTSRPAPAKPEDANCRKIINEIEDEIFCE
jgi:cell division septation protein DedD